MKVQRLAPARIEGRHVLYGLFAFFGVMLLANGIFLYFALDTYNGLETQNAYREGLGYNARIEHEARQAARGWQPRAHYDGATGRLVLEVSDRRGNGVAGLAIRGELRRPVTDREDRTLAFREVAPARYSADVALAPGQWIVILDLQAAG
ncbi:MAG: hypothetical protein D6773_02800, partial [Alphaproteobacteria bacterium]